MTTNEFKEDYDVTVGVEFGTLLFKFEEEKILKIQVWDTAGQENFKAITKMFYRAADCILFCFDMTSRKSFENLLNWHDEVMNSISSEDKIIMFLVATKADLEAERQVTEEQALALRQ
jgi:Ras-related protein Rab-2A